MISKNFIYATKGLICSASGWRKKFLLNNNYLQDYDALFFYYALKCFIYLQRKEYAQFIHKNKNIKQKLQMHIAVALDTREASKELATIATYAIQHFSPLLDNIFSISHSSHMLGIVPIPVALSYTKACADALIFITASHNPKEYSGIKFCQGNGQVLVPKKNKQLSTLCMNMAKKELGDTISNAQTELLATIRSQITTIDSNTKNVSITLNNKPNKQKNTHDIIYPYKNKKTKSIFDTLTTEYSTTLEKAIFRGNSYKSSFYFKKLFVQKIQEYKKHLDTIPSVIWDVNGGARCWQGDTIIFKQYGIGLDQINTKPGVFAHEIVPEGTALQQAAQMLYNYNTQCSSIKTKKKNTYLFAIISDCDGDRGNTILYNFKKQVCKNLSAQEIFALILTIELAWECFIQKNTDCNTTVSHMSQNSIQKKLAVVINDASSLRINTIAQQYSASVFRSEVGEANVVSLASELRKKKYTIPVSGEASNGGIIMYPSFVRDPLHTSFSLLKAILFFEELFPHLNKKRIQQIKKQKFPVNPLITLLGSLPKAASTSIEDTLAKLTIPSLSMSQVFYRIINKSNILIKNISALFKNKGITIDSHTLVSHSEKKHIIIDPNTLTENNTLQGGLSIYLYNKQNPIAMVWLRQSATEPIVRIIADVIGNYSTYLERNVLKLWRTFLIDILKK